MGHFSLYAFILLGCFQFLAFPLILLTKGADKKTASEKILAGISCIVIFLGVVFMMLALLIHF